MCHYNLWQTFKTLPPRKTARISAVIMITTLLRHDHQIEVILSQDLHLDLLTNQQDHVIKNQQCQLWLRHPLSRQQITLFRDFPPKVTLSTDIKMVSLTSSQPRMRGAQFQCLDLSLVQNRPVRIPTLKQGNKLLVTGVIIKSDFISSSGTPRHSRITRYSLLPLRGQVNKSDLVVRGPFAGTEESTTKSAGITVITGYQADISGTLATTLPFYPVTMTNGKKSFENRCFKCPKQPRCRLSTLYLAA